MLKIALFIFVFLPIALDASLDIGVGTIPTSNQRKKPEDFYYVPAKQSIDSVDGLIVGVFDGHSSTGSGVNDGFRVAKHAQENIAFAICKATLECTNCEQALKLAFDNLEQQIPDKESCQFCGTTAIVGFAKDNSFLIANSGDSQALIVFKSSITMVTSPNKAIPKTTEGDRIKQHKGIIYDMYAFDFDGNTYILSKKIDYSMKVPGIEWFDEFNKADVDKKVLEILEHQPERLDNFCKEWFVGLEKETGIRRLGMSRSLGDFGFKNVGVISEPEIYRVPLNEIDYIIFASDGLWNGATTDDIILFISKERYNKSPTQMCQELSEFARENGSTDDITIVGLFFK